MSKIEIDEKGREARIVIDTRFYGYNSILQACKDFTESCWVYMDGSIEDKILVTLKPKATEIEISLLPYDFINYITGLMQNATYS